MKMAGPFTTKIYPTIYLNPLHVEFCRAAVTKGGEGTVIKMMGVGESFYEVEEELGHVLNSLERAMA
jgi:hypothetical protein